MDVWSFTLSYIPPWSSVVGKFMKILSSVAFLLSWSGAKRRKAQSRFLPAGTGRALVKREQRKESLLLPIYAIPCLSACSSLHIAKCLLPWSSVMVMVVRISEALEGESAEMAWVCSCPPVYRLRRWVSCCLPAFLLALMSPVERRRGLERL